MIENLYRIFQEHPVITTDSRKISPGSIFFALQGENFNGNRFADDALEQGAAFVVVDEPASGKDDRFFLTDDVLTTLQELAQYHRKKLSLPIIAITGSNGKTTTKDLIHAILSQKYRIHSTSGNLNNHIGVPLTLLSIQQDTEIAVVEMGANHPGEIAFLCNMAEPTHGLITNIGKAHLEGFESLEGVVRAKTELYDFLRKREGTVFINADDSLLMKHAEGLSRITYGFNPEANVSGMVIPGADCLRIELSIKNQKNQLICSNLFGKYNALNILAAACIGDQFEISFGDITSAIEAYTPANNRSQVQKTDHNLLILDAYNANPTSMKMVLKDFAETAETNKMVILGDMLELGKVTDTEHKKILEILDEMSFSRIFLVGPVFSQLNTNPDWRCFETCIEAKEWFAKNRIANAAILLKGSRGIRLEEITEYL